MPIPFKATYKALHPLFSLRVSSTAQGKLLQQLSKRSKNLLTLVHIKWLVEKGREEKENIVHSD